MVIEHVRIGVFGKLPARGDFVRAGLPGDFVVAWDGWLQQVIGGSQALLGAAWLAAWLEAPVWRFALAPGVCGAGGVLGLMLPSVDRVGRYFPLTLAAVWPAHAPPAAAETAAAWLDACEAAGRTALEAGSGPQQVLAAMPPPPRAAPTGRAAASLWWTAGGPRVDPARLGLPRLPCAMRYAAMLDRAAPTLEAGRAQREAPDARSAAVDHSNLCRCPSCP